MTPTARRMASELGSACCYAEADRLLNVVAGVNFGAKRVERTTRLVGDDLERWRTEWLSGSITVVGGDGEASNDASFDGAPVRRPLKEGRILCVGLDGTGVPALPSETAGRKGKDGGRATTREAKVGAVWVVEPDGEGGMRPAPGSTRYFAAVESAEDDAKGDSPVARRLLRELAALGFAPEDVGVALGDGADWLRRLYGTWFPNAARIVDFFHAAEYLWAAARSRHGDDAKAAKRWAEKLCRLLEAGRMDDVLGAPPPRRGSRGTRQGGPLPVRAARPDALRRVPLARPADRFGARRGGLQDGGGAAHEMHRHALDGGRRQPRALGALRPPRRLVRRLLGTPPQAGSVRRWRTLTQNLSHTLAAGCATDLW